MLVLLILMLFAKYYIYVYKYFFLKSTNYFFPQKIINIYTIYIHVNIFRISKIKIAYKKKLLLLLL